ncbi:MAG: phage portal protein [Roseburia sp.]
MANWIDKIIGSISPKWGYYREAWSQSAEQLRNYDAGDYGRLNANWRPLNESAELTDRYNRDTVRARARDLERNSDIANSIIGAYKRNVVGGGFNLQARTENEDLNQQIEALWKIWIKKHNCDVTETQSFSQIIRMAVERKKVDGGMLIHKCFTTGGILPFKLQCLEVDELDISQMSPHKAGNRVIGGIEVNNYNKADGYWVKQSAPDGIDLGQSVFVPQKDMIFLFSKKRPSQIREISDLAPTITRVRDANEFMTAVSVKERILSCLSVFVKRAVPSNLRAAGRFGDGGDDNQYNYNGKTLAPGMIKNLNPGDDVVAINPSGQSGDATTFIKLMQRLIGAGQGISYEATSRDMSESNYSSTRQGIIEDDLTYSEDCDLITEVMDEIYETFIISAVLAGKLGIKDFWGNKEKYMGHEWIKAPKKWIDPLKESNANKIAMMTGQKTFQQISAEAGRDWREQIDDMAEALQYANKKGVEIGGVLGYEQKSSKKE